MGGLFGSVTNTGVQDPNGRVSFPKPSQMPQALAPQPGQLQPTSANIQGDVMGPGQQAPPAPPVTFNEPTQQFPEAVKPTFEQAASLGGRNGAPNAMSPGLNKAGKLLTLLTSGLQGAMAGRAASEQSLAASGGRRSAGFGTGFEAGQQAPWQRAMQGQQLEQAQAQTAATKAMGDMVPTPYGMMPASLAKVILPAQIRADATTGAAGINAKAGITKEQMAGQNRLDVEGLKTQIAKSKGTNFKPDVDPQTGQQFYHVYNEFGQEVGRADVNVIPQLMARTTSTTDHIALDDGSIAFVPKTTTSGPVIPGAAAQPQGAPRPTGTTAAPAANVAKGADGQPLKAAGSSQKDMKWVYWTEPDTGRTVSGPLSMAKQMGAKNPSETPTTEVDKIQSARQVVNLITKQGDAKKPETQGILQLIDSLDKDGKLGVVASRMEGFLAGKVGTTPDDDPRIMSLFNKTDLAMTKSMQAHFGASGGRSPQMLEHFLSMANAKKMDAPTLRSGIKAINDYMEDNAMMPSQKQAGGEDPVAGLLNKYAPKPTR